MAHAVAASTGSGVGGDGDPVAGRRAEARRHRSEHGSRPRQATSRLTCGFLGATASATGDEKRREGRRYTPRDVGPRRATTARRSDDDRPAARAPIPSTGPGSTRASCSSFVANPGRAVAGPPPRMGDRRRLGGASAIAATLLVLVAFGALGEPEPLAAPAPGRHRRRRRRSTTRSASRVGQCVAPSVVTVPRRPATRRHHRRLRRRGQQQTGCSRAPTSSTGATDGRWSTPASGARLRAQGHGQRPRAPTSRCSTVRRRRPRARSRSARRTPPRSASRWSRSALDDGEPPRGTSIDIVSRLERAR